MPIQMVADEIKPHIFGNGTAAMSSVRCRRRFADFMLLNSDLRDSSSTPSKLLTDEEKQGVLKERYWLFVRCLSTKPGEEPSKTPFLYTPKA